jgi:multimeric flavodoxin WrbA
VSLRGKTLLPCSGCYGCAEAKECVQKGDDFAELFDKMHAAQGILVSSPVYYASAVPQLMCLLERAGFAGRMSGKFFSGKVGAPITVARRTGHTFAFAQLLLWYFINDMIIPGSIYWNVGVAGAKGARDAENDAEGIKILEHFAKNMAHVMRKLKQ